MTLRKNLILLANELDELNQTCNDPFERIKEMGKIWDQIRRDTPTEPGPVSMLYGILENYAHNRMQKTFFELAKYYEIDLCEDDPAYDL